MQFFFVFLVILILLVFLVPTTCFCHLLTMTTTTPYPKSCHDYGTEEECNDTGDEISCEWNSSDGWCDAYCPDFSSYQTCEYQFSCDWSNDACINDPNCPSYSTQHSCIRAGTCEWNGDECDHKLCDFQDGTANNGTCRCLTTHKVGDSSLGYYQTYCVEMCEGNGALAGPTECLCPYPDYERDCNATWAPDVDISNVACTCERKPACNISTVVTLNSCICPENTTKQSSYSCNMYGCNFTQICEIQTTSTTPTAAMSESRIANPDPRFTVVLICCMLLCNLY